MPAFREARADDAAAAALLTEYFASRAETFPAGPDAYRTVFPSAEEFEPPRGVFLVVEGEDLAGEAADVGCGGIRRLSSEDETAPRFEVKHLWLQPHVRRQGLGRLLLAELESRARAFGAAELVLDTNESLAAAGGLYRSSGFEEIPPYNDNPNATHWFAKRL